MIYPPRLSRRHKLCGISAILLILISCNFPGLRVSEVQPSASPVPVLATPNSQLPAAGICAPALDPLVVVTIYPDIPDPRCVIVYPTQQLKVVNQRPETLQVSIAGLQASVVPGGEHTFQVPFGELLAPGVHLIQVLPCCGAELWLQPSP